MCLFYMSLQKVLEGCFQLSLLQRLSGDRHQSGKEQTSPSLRWDCLVCGRALHVSGNPREPKTFPRPEKARGLGPAAEPWPSP